MRQRGAGQVGDQRVDHTANGFRHGAARRQIGIARQHLGVMTAEDGHILHLLDRDQARPQAVVDVVVVVGDLVGQVGQLRLQRGLGALQEAHAHRAQLARVRRRAVLEDAFARLEAQVQAVEVGVALFQLVHHAQALQVVLEAAGLGRQLAHAGVEFVLPGVAERRVAQIMGQRDGLGQVFRQGQAARQRASDLRHFQAVGQAGAEQVAFVIDEDLGLVFQPPERAGMHDAVAIALELGPIFRRRLGMGPTARSGRVGCIGSQFVHLHCTVSCHGCRSSRWSGPIRRAPPRRAPRGSRPRRCGS